MKDIKGYKINTKLFFLPIVIILPLLIILISEEGLDVFSKTKTYYCPDEAYFGDCFFENNISLQPGEIKIYNQQTHFLIPIINYGTWLLIILILIFNHFKYNTT